MGQPVQAGCRVPGGLPEHTGPGVPCCATVNTVGIRAIGKELGLAPSLVYRTIKSGVSKGGENLALGLAHTGPAEESENVL